MYYVLIDFNKYKETTEDQLKNGDIIYQKLNYEEIGYYSNNFYLVIKLDNSDHELKIQFVKLVRHSIISNQFTCKETIVYYLDKFSLEYPFDGYRNSSFILTKLKSE